APPSGSGFRRSESSPSPVRLRELPLKVAVLATAIALAAGGSAVLLDHSVVLAGPSPAPARVSVTSAPFDQAIANNVTAMVSEGRDTFRFDTFGDEAFWGDTLKLHLAIEGSALGGVGPGISPKTALGLGLKVDADALSPDTLNALRKGSLDLDDPAATLALLK